MRGDRRDTRVRGVERGGPTYRSGFGTAITNRGVVGHGQSGGGRFRGEEELKSVEGKIGPCESTPSNPVSRKVRAKGFCGRDVCGLVVSAGDERCNYCTPAEVHGKNERLCLACHQPICDWTHFPRFTCRGRLNTSRTDAKKRGEKLPEALLEGCAPSTDGLCTRSDCVVQFVRRGEMADGRKRSMCPVCKAHNPSKKRVSLSHAHAAEVIRFFTTGMGTERRHSTVDCTGTSLI